MAPKAKGGLALCTLVTLNVSPPTNYFTPSIPNTFDMYLLILPLQAYTTNERKKCQLLLKIIDLFGAKFLLDLHPFAVVGAFRGCEGRNPWDQSAQFNRQSTVPGYSTDSAHDLATGEFHRIAYWIYGGKFQRVR